MNEGSTSVGGYGSSPPGQGREGETVLCQERAVMSVLVPSSGLVHRSSLQSKPFPGQTTGMAAERAGDAALSEEQVDLAVEQLEASEAGPAMRGSLAKLSGRVTTESNLEVTMRAESQDKYKGRRGRQSCRCR